MDVTVMDDSVLFWMITEKHTFSPIIQGSLLIQYKSIWEYVSLSEMEKDEVGDANIESLISLDDGNENVIPGIRLTTDSYYSCIIYFLYKQDNPQDPLIAV